MVLYLQANYCGTFAIAELNKWQNLESDNPLDWNAFFTLEDDIPGDTPLVEINKMVVEKYGCKKLVLDF